MRSEAVEDAVTFDHLRGPHHVAVEIRTIGLRAGVRLARGQPPRRSFARVVRSWVEFDLAESTFSVANPIRASVSPLAYNSGHARLTGMLNERPLGSRSACPSLLDACSSAARLVGFARSSCSAD